MEEFLAALTAIIDVAIAAFEAIITALQAVL